MSEFREYSLKQVHLETPLSMVPAMRCGLFPSVLDRGFVFRGAGRSIVGGLRCGFLASLLVLIACAGDVDPLGAGARPDSAVDPAAESCSIDFAAQNLREMRELGLRVSDSIVEGQLGAWEPHQGAFRAPLTISKVWFGAHFLAGTTAFVALDAAKIAELGAPGPIVAGFSRNPFPTRDSDGSVSWWAPSILIPRAEAAPFSALIGYRPERAPILVAATLIGLDEDRAHFRAGDPIRGEAPPEFSANWSSRAYAVNFPTPSRNTYLVSMSSVQQFPDVALATITDIRPSSAEALVEIERAVGLPPIDIMALRNFAAEYRLSWNYHRAPEVLATSVSAIAGECCTGAGGTYVEHEVVTALRSDGTTRLIRGGHAYFSAEVCGDRAILALGSRVPSMPLPAGCDPSNNIERAPVTPVLAELPDSQENRARVGEWLTVAAPVYRLHAGSELLSSASLARDASAPWSAPLSLISAIHVAAPVLIDVLAVEKRDGWSEVTLATNFADRRYDHLMMQPFKMAARCGDPRLKVGSSWLGPIFREEDGTAAFLVPGVLLPVSDEAARLGSARLE